MTSGSRSSVAIWIARPGRVERGKIRAALAQSFQNPLNQFPHFVQVERLLQVRTPGKIEKSLGFRAGDIPGGEDDPTGQGGVEPLQLTEQLLSTHARHLQVGNHDVEWA